MFLSIYYSLDLVVKGMIDKTIVNVALNLKNKEKIGTKSDTGNVPRLLEMNGGKGV